MTSAETKASGGTQLLRLAFAAIRLAAVIALLPFAFDWRSPDFTTVRPIAMAILFGIPALIAGCEIWLARRGLRGWPRVLCIITCATAATVVLATATLEGRFQWQRRQVLATAPDQLERLGRHFVIGFADWPDARNLVERRAIAGIYVSAGNIHGMTVENIRRKIDDLQAVRREQGLPPLWIATDQEGGNVSRLSPPLARMPTLAATIARSSDAQERTLRVQDYATRQGRELKAAGINLNFAPVVDLNFNIVSARDVSTRIYTRAISDDPETVRSVAADYCASLHTVGVACTLKHFPGLGRVAGDTHRETAALHTPVEQLEKADWIPFRALGESGALIMIGHASLDALDPQRPASLSQAVIARLRTWAGRAVLITDDFSMLAVYHSREGIGGGSVAALNAGIDLILISYDFDQFYPAMYALMQADHDGRLNREMLAESDRRAALTKPSDH